MDNNLSKGKILELANMFLSNVFSLYEFEKMCGISSKVILEVFHKDLYEINEEKARQVNRILSQQKCLTHKGYMRELVCSV